MGWTNAIVLFVVVWWVCFLMALPFGVRPSDNPGSGHAAGAPERPHLAIKAAVATAAAALVTAAAALAVAYDLVDFRSYFAGP